MAPPPASEPASPAAAGVPHFGAAIAGKTAYLSTGSSIYSSESFIRQAVALRQRLAGAFSSAREHTAGQTTSTVQTLVEFPDPDLLRATRLLTVLHRGGQILGDCKGSADTYNLSCRAPGINAFISHNWAMGRSLKFTLLAMHFNTRLATLAALAVMTLIDAGTCWGFVPLAQTSRGERGFVGMCCTVPVFFLVLFFGHELGGLLGRPGPWVFLDKVCIHQTDEFTQRQGILKLGAFLKHSSCVVLVFSDLYLKKLWTVYELAAYLVVHRGDFRALHVLPCGASVRALTTYPLPTLGLAILRLLDYVDSPIPPRAAQIAAVLVPSCLGMVNCRLWAYEQHRAMLAAADFTIKNATCAVEADAVLVYSNIVTLMKEYNYVGAEAEDEEALEVFDRYVRLAVPRAFYASTGRTTWPYKFGIPMSLGVLADMMDRWSASYRLGEFGSHEEAWYHLLAVFTTCFAALPLAIAFGMFWTRQFVEVRGAKEVAYVGLGVVFLSALFLLADMTPLCGQMAGWLLVGASTSGASRALFLLVCALLNLATVCVYRPPASDAPMLPGAGLHWGRRRMAGAQEVDTLHPLDVEEVREQEDAGGDELRVAGGLFRTETSQADTLRAPHLSAGHCSFASGEKDQMLDATCTPSTRPASSRSASSSPCSL